jgi:hypothetical protein
MLCITLAVHPSYVGERTITGMQILEPMAPNSGNPQGREMRARSSGPLVDDSGMYGTTYRSSSSSAFASARGEAQEKHVPGGAAVDGARSDP